MMIRSMFVFLSCFAMCLTTFAQTDSNIRHGGGSTKCETMYLIRCEDMNVYRSFDGKCNNLEHPTWGAGGTVLRRLLTPEYDDNSGQPRQSGISRPLPSSRLISNKMKESNPPISKAVSQMHVLYGQLISHDVAHTPKVKSSSGESVECDCERPSKNCVNVKLPKGDPIRKSNGKSCLPLLRSRAVVSRSNCTFQHREQITTMSSYIDGTFLYGKSDEEADDLRDPLSDAGELLLVRSPYGGPHKNLPKQKDMKNKKISSTMSCNPKLTKPLNGSCFVSGDVRVGENTGLVAIQTVFARYHNWVATELKTRNPHWNSDKVYFEARKIVCAITQSITYREYLPPLVGPRHMKLFGLTLTDKGFWNGYDSRYDASITSEFTTAAFRYGHSQVSSIMKRPTAFYNSHTIDPVLTKDSFFNTEPFQEKKNGGPGSLLRGFTIGNAERTDTNFVDALRDQMFALKGKHFGRDLFAINIQRGRDHGLPGYNNYREFCGFKRAKTFSDLRDDISLRTRQKLQSLYDDVDDIDLYVGGLAENHVEGGIVGPTFACILSFTMRSLRRGDRLWHERQDSHNPFTLPQLESIRKVGLASMLCQTGEDMKYAVTRPLQLRLPGLSPYISSCGNIAKLNLDLWSRSTVQRAEYTSNQAGTEWTTWFVTNIKNDVLINPQREFARIKAIRGDSVCESLIDWQIRRVMGDAFVQIRFSCKVGTIFATDFPFQASEEYKWTQWIEKQSVSRFEFQCNRVIAVQAKTIDGISFALETGDVLEKFGPYGFSCKDRHQVNGKCHRYKVRALCSKSNVYTFTPTTKAPTTGTKPSLPSYVQTNSNLLCKYYNICCGKSETSYTYQFIPSNVRRAAESYCNTYNICCDV